MFKRLGLWLINIFFPPLSVLLLCGPDADFAINCALFICAVIPSHIHCFYISFTYFGRKKKVRKGKYPGDWRGMIYSEKVQYGGATKQEYKQLKWEKENGKTGGIWSRSSSRKSKRQEWNDDSTDSNVAQTSSHPQMVSRHSSARSGTYTHEGGTNPTNLPYAPQRLSSARNSAYAPSFEPGVVEGQSHPQMVQRTSSARNSEYSQPGINQHAAMSQRTTSRRNGAYPPNAFMSQGSGMTRSNSRSSSINGYES